MDKISNLTPEQQKLFIQLLQQEGIAAQVPAIPRRKTVETLPSFAQQRLWFLQEFETEKSLYNCSLVMSLKGPLQVDWLHRALEQIVTRHESLRTTFEMKEGQPLLRTNPPGPVDLRVVELSGPGREETHRNKLIEEEARLAFDLGRSPLLRALLLRSSAHEHVLILTMHHIASDAWSLEIFSREMAALYESFSKGEEPALPELPIQYADYSTWQRDWLQTGVLEKQLGYWKKQLEGLPELLELSIAHARPPIQGHTGRRHRFVLQPSLRGGLTQLSQSQGVTLFMTLLASFQVLLWRYSGQTDVVVGTPIAGRHWRETEPLIGFFVNTLVLRSNLTGNPTFGELLRTVSEVALAAFSNQDVPFEKLVDDLLPGRDMSRNPLFQIMLVLQNTATPKWRLHGLELEQQEVIETGTSKFDLTLQLQEKDDQLNGLIVYRDDLFDESAIQRMALHFEALLRAIVDQPGTRIGELEILDVEEKRQVIERWNETAAPPPAHRFLHGWFEEQANATPGAVAIKYEGASWSYVELNQRTNQLANYLQSLGAGPEKLVGFCLQRTPQIIAAMLGILKAGAAYVPLDPTYPEERLRYMLEDSGASVLLVDNTWTGNYENMRLRVVNLENEQDSIARLGLEPPTALVDPRMAAYVVYTSGSTGLPKGVVIEHRSAAELLEWSGRTFDKEELAGMLFSTSVCFDLSVFEVFVPLSFGGTVILAENALLLPQAHREEITLINTVPSAMIELLRSNALPSRTKTINLAGEALRRDTVQQIYQRQGVQRIVNLYGPTEDTTYSTYAQLDPGEDGKVPIGRPISNTQAYVLDENLQPAPIGVAGELYLGGAGLARGYLNRPDMTAARFRPNPFARQPGNRLYETGDRARWLPNGSLEYLGRVDNQVKLRGYRIELGEIETALRTHEKLAQAAVIVHETKTAEQQLVGYLVLQPGKSALSVESVRAYLGTRLPAYMIPEVFVVLDQLPLNSNGKLDRKRLQKSGGGRLAPKKAYVAPRNSTEELLAGIWADALQCAPIGMEDDFFALGGQSLRAMQVASRLREILQIDVPVRLIFTSSTIAALSSALQNLEAIPGQMEKMARVFLTIQQMSIEEVDSKLKAARSV